MASPPIWAVVSARLTVTNSLALVYEAVSIPAPPSRRSLPNPPSKISLPFPPVRELLMVFPIKMSLKLEPIRFSMLSRISFVASPPFWAVVIDRLTMTPPVALA